MCAQESEKHEREGEKRTRERIEHIFGKKDSVGTWGEQARVGFREEEAVCVCLRMIIDAVGGRKRGRENNVDGKGDGTVVADFSTVSGRNGVPRALRKR